MHHLQLRTWTFKYDANRPNSGDNIKSMLMFLNIVGASCYSVLSLRDLDK